MLAAGGLALEASAADVRADLGTRETYVGMPVKFQIEIANATDYDPPVVPEIPGLRIESLGQPSQSSNISWINGTVTKKVSVIYSFAVTPTQPGSFRIPAISVSADGQTLSTKPFEFVATKSETKDLLFVQVEGKEKQIYVGQALDLQLKIWVRPYSDKEHGITLSEGDMWQLLSQRTNWGPFQARIEQLAANNQRPVGVEVLRKDGDGNNHGYYLYEIDGTIYPKKPGRIDANDVQVVVLYPTAIGQSRDPFDRMFEDMGMQGGPRSMFGGGMSMFGPRLEVESVRPVIAEVKVEPIEVLDVPVANRPADYRGAVGKYRIASKAVETDVKAGDPINLILAVTGNGPLDLVQAPPLAELPSLAAEFKVPNEPLAGYVDGGRKLFSTTIRPRKAGIAEIPPIPFTYFDPDIGKFITTTSAPIAIKVAPAETLALADVVGRNQATFNTNDPAAAAAADGKPQLVIYTGGDLLLNESVPKAISQATIALLALPPIVVLVLALVRGRNGLPALAFWFSSNVRRFEARIRQASQPADIGDALRVLLAKRFGLSTTADSASVVGALRSAGYRHVAVRCERVFQKCESAGAAPIGGLSLNELGAEAIAAIQDIQSQRRPMRVKAASSPTSGGRLQHTSPVVVGLVLAGALLAPASEAAAALDNTQRQTVLAEADQAYSAALANATTDSAEAKESFADAAAKYELVADSGVQNSRLYFNLANAYLQSGATGRAIANYRRALRLDPTNHNALTNLTYAESLLPTADSTDKHPPATSFASFTNLANGWLNRFIRPAAILTAAIVGWIAFWTTIGLRLCEVKLPWKTLATCSLLVTAIAAASYATSCRSASRQEAVVVSADAKLKAGDGDKFANIGGVSLHTGQSIEWLKRRGEWVLVRTGEGQSGWLERKSVEIL